MNSVLNSDSGSLAGRTALVTGGATLVGHGVVRALHERGADAIVADIDPDGAQPLVDELGVRFVHLDITMDALTEGDRAKTDRVAAPFHLTGRVGDPIEVGRVVAFLASDLASVVTGADWAADGGYSAMGPEQAVPAIPKLSE